MLLIDGHLDLAMNALNWNRDLKLPVHETRKLEAGMERKGRAAGTVAFPEMRRGNIAITFCTVIARVTQPGAVREGYRTHEIAYGHAQGQLAYYLELERQGVIRMISDWPAYEAHLQEWNDDPDSTPLGMVLTMEGADPIVAPSQVGAWWDQGLRVISLAHYGPSAYAKGTESVGGLTQMGRDLLSEMDSLEKMILDVTHLSDDSFWEAVEHFKGPVLATHSNCREMVPGDRQLTDDMLRHLIERGAVIGAVLDAWMLQPNWIRGETTPENVTLNTVVDHIDYVCQLAGNARHAAIGSDLDGGYGTEQTPNDLDTIADLQKIAELLGERGYSESDIELIFHGNWSNLLQRVWTA
ncbi:membrane dipeptidase [soil metagenome]